jgi:16S rRNA (uracil1498-N3)-methyltransferase
MRRRFFVDRFERDSATLHADAAEHLGRVLRAEPGQLYELSDGHRVWLARIERVSLSKRGANSIEFALVEPIDAIEPSLRLQLLISIVKFDRFEWCLEKATELGVDEIIPLAAARTDKALVAAAGKRQERWNRILLESAQQARRLRPPALQSPQRPSDAFAQSTAATRIFLSERCEAKSLRDLVQSKGAQARVPVPLEPNRESAAVTVSLAVGPEGGWTLEEISVAATGGFLEASLGDNILRTETAVIASLAIMQFALGTR